MLVVPAAPPLVADFAAAVMPPPITDTLEFWPQSRMSFWLLLFNVFVIAMLVTVLMLVDVKPTARQNTVFQLEQVAVQPVDCMTKTVACFTSADCRIQCTSSIMSCNPQTGTCGAPNDLPDTKCNPKHGIFAILTGDPSLGTASFKCRSIYYPYIWTDGDKLKPNVCDGNDANFNIDLTVEEYNPFKCTCYGKKLYVFSDNIPRCLLSQLLFERSY